MLSTKKFKTKTEFVPRNNGHIPGTWELAIDIGYSAVKLFSPNIIARFPSYAMKVENDFNYMSDAPANSILVRDLNLNELWLVGEQAQYQIDTRNSLDSENTLYGRDRYTSPMFSIIVKASLAIGMLDNEFGTYNNEPIVIQSGLPELYMSDKDILIDVLAKPHRFEIKIGNDEWKSFDIKIEKENIYLMSQPKGSLLSVCIDKDGSWHPEAKKYMNSSVLVFDPGFGTLDLFPIRSGVVGHGETFADLGMKRILQETANKIKQEYNVTIQVAAMQPCLETGTVRVGNVKLFESSDEPIGEFLVEASHKVFEDAIERMVNSVNIMDYDYMIITGGTGAAWKHYIQEKFKKLSTLQLLYANQNDSLPFVYSNVRGYYLYRFNMLGKEQAKNYQQQKAYA